MKATLILVALLAVVGAFLPAPARAATVAPPPEFRNEQSLSGHGEWITVQRFGVVWRPFVAVDWRPFLYGDWLYTDAGWYWNSYEPYGWVTDHYGNWYFDPEYGWVWVPGYDWSPAQVSWLDYGDYIGWGPLPPPGVLAPDPFFAPEPVAFFSFVSINDFDRDDVSRFVVQKPPARPANAAQVRRQSPDPARIEKVTGKKMQPVPLKQEVVQAQNRQLKRAVLPADIAKRTDGHRKDFEHRVMRASAPPPPHPRPHKQKP